MSFYSHVGGNDVERVCDVCGIRRPQRRLRAVGKYYVCEKHPGWAPREILEKDVQIIKMAPEPVRNARGFEPRNTYQAAEEEIFNFITRDSAVAADAYSVLTAQGAPTTTGSPQAAAWASIYLADLIDEGERPVSWITRATARLREYADWLYSNQAAGPGISGTTDDQLQWGAYATSSSYVTLSSCLAGLALLRAYEILGVSRYLAAARACAWYLRSAQCGDMISTHPSSTDAAGSSVKHHGMWTLTITVAGSWDHRYSPSNLIGVEFLTRLRAVVGDETIGSSTLTSPFTSSRATTISNCLAEARAFWATPQYSVTDGAAVLGFSTATPRALFNSYPATKGTFSGTGSWEFSSGTFATTATVNSSVYAHGLRGIRAADGDTAFVTGMHDWLMATAADSTHALPATTANRMVSGYDDRVIYSGVKGDFNARIAPPTAIRVASNSAYVNVASTAVYELGAVGQLAGLYASRQATYFKALKDLLCEPRPRFRNGHSEGDGQYLFLGPMGRCGLSFQPFTAEALTRFNFVSFAAQLGSVYRQAPKAALGRGLV